jgi:hypothetical protein
MPTTSGDWATTLAAVSACAVQWLYLRYSLGISSVKYLPHHLSSAKNDLSQSTVFGVGPDPSYAMLPHGTMVEAEPRSEHAVLLYGCRRGRPFR